jgi:hypothetical protein
MMHPNDFRCLEIQMSCLICTFKKLKDNPNGHVQKSI